MMLGPVPLLKTTIEFAPSMLMYIENDVVPTPLNLCIPRYQRLVFARLCYYLYTERRYYVCTEGVLYLKRQVVRTRLLRLTFSALNCFLMIKDDVTLCILLFASIQ